MIPQILMGVGAAALAAWGITAGVKSAKEEKKRLAMPIEWDPRFPREAFQDVVNRTAQRLPRVYASNADGLIVTIHVKSNSGLTSWKAVVDFHDYGRLTGWYRMTSENDQSPIPQAMADAIVAEVHARLGEPLSADWTRPL
ncbi:hypothetical protein [Microbacterium sp. RU33B]|uniref:hypothetical protein n=1 Tax=Microbacterium sp. RU33B TaxID=1907390 RepID=UPI00095C612C|nr:hypothetical protein [Microbacterium sp. RU33B]SIT72588.1 hypothetical protein SAMN05880545_1077 [Microbacterium sp. RU33B]